MAKSAAARREGFLPYADRAALKGPGIEDWLFLGDIVPEASSNVFHRHLKVLPVERYIWNL